MSFPGGMLGLQNSLKKKKKSYEMMWHNIFEFRKSIFFIFFLEYFVSLAFLFSAYFFLERCSILTSHSKLCVMLFSI